MNSFRNFFFKFLKSYKIFGITPYKNVNSSVTVSYITLGLVVITVVLGWIGVILSVSKDMKTDGLVTIANVIQFISKYLTFTMILMYPLLRKNLMNSIVDSFENIDTELKFLQVQPKYDKAIKINNISLIICFLYQVITSTYDFVIVFIVNKTEDFFLHWIISKIPGITITFAMLQSCTVIYLINERCKIVNKVIDDMCIKNVQPRAHEILYVGNNLTFKEMFVKIRSALAELGRVSRLVRMFYGPFFFTVFATSFVIICIQMFYCYLVVVTETVAKGYDVWSMISSIITIVTNLIMIVSITTLCEHVMSEVSIF